MTPKGILTAFVHAALKELKTDEERLELMEELVGGFCRHCGRYHVDEGMKCQCWNDE